MHGVAINCLRIDLPLASEGFVYNAPELDKSDWQPTEVGAEAALWILGQPPAFSGQIKSLSELRREQGVAVERAAR